MRFYLTDQNVCMKYERVVKLSVSDTGVHGSFPVTETRPKTQVEPCPNFAQCNWVQVGCHGSWANVLLYLIPEWIANNRSSGVS